VPYMLRHNLLLIYRNFKRYKSTFLINLIGLSIGMACTLLIFLWVKDELNIDKFHENGSSIYQVMMQYKSEDGIGVGPETFSILAETLAEEIPEVELAVSEAVNPDKSLLIVNDQSIKSSGAYASKDYFNVFSYPLYRGDKDKVLAEESHIVISRDLALKLFSSTEDIIGKEITIDGKGQYLVSGVFSIPSSSTKQFDFVLPLATAFKHYPNLKNNWNNSWVNTHVLLKEGADATQLNPKITDLIHSNTGSHYLTAFTRKYSDAYLYGKYENGVQAGGRIDYVWLFSIIAVFIILIACINFMNLSTANASRKLKEVGIKKAI